jgi:hypothetical protein
MPSWHNGGTFDLNWAIEAAPATRCVTLRHPGVVSLAINVAIMEGYFFVREPTISDSVRLW